MLNQDFKDFLEVNRYKEIDWYNGERFKQMLSFWQTASVIQVFADHTRKQPEIKTRLEDIQGIVIRSTQAGMLAEYQVAKLLNALS